MQNRRQNITFLLPIGLAPNQYHDLARAVVSHMPNQARARETVLVPRRGYLALSDLGQTPPEGVPILNDSTWTLNMSVPEGTDLRALAMSVKRLPGGAEIEIEPVARYHASNPET